ncbi:unnamed protein product, partial [Ectocarpus sp. 12 AP-2014]
GRHPRGGRLHLQSCFGGYLELDPPLPVHDDGSGECNTGFATPTIKLCVLMRRERLANTCGLAVQENHEYADAAAAAAAAARGGGRGRGGGGGAGGEDVETNVKDWDVYLPGQGRNEGKHFWRRRPPKTCSRAGTL